MTDADLAARLRSLLPARWFPDTTPVLDGLLAGLSAGWGRILAIIEYAAQQTRIATASDRWASVPSPNSCWSSAGNWRPCP